MPVSYGDHVDSSRENLLVDEHKYELLVDVYYTGSFFNVAVEIAPKLTLIGSHPGKAYSLVKRVDDKENIESTVTEVVEDLVDRVSDYHEAMDLSIEVTVS